MNIIRWIFAMLLVASVSGCANHVFQGTTSALDSQGEERQVVLYWTKTDPLLGKAKAGPASLLTQCGVPITFVERENGIVFRGIPGQDHITVGEGVDDPDMICGRLNGPAKFTSIEDGNISVNVFCVPVINEFSEAKRRSHIASREEPYQFSITSTTKRSLFGGLPPVPEPFECQSD